MIAFLWLAANDACWPLSGGCRVRRIPSPSPGRRQADEGGRGEERL